MVDMGRVSRSFLGRSPDLRHRHIDEVLGGAQPTSLIAMSGAGLVLAAPAVATPAAEKSRCSPSNSSRTTSRVTVSTGPRRCWPPD